MKEKRARIAAGHDRAHQRPVGAQAISEFIVNTDLLKMVEVF
jgi:hypothetical protein